MIIKKGVSLEGLHVSMRLVLAFAESTYLSFGKEAVITSGTEGHVLDKVHGISSYHYYGMALDFRTRFFDDATAMKVADKLRSMLGSKYSVVCEGNQIHVQYNWGKF